jgi:hypothetical protein
MNFRRSGEIKYALVAQRHRPRAGGSAEGFFWSLSSQKRTRYAHFKFCRD